MERVAPVAVLLCAAFFTAAAASASIPPSLLARSGSASSSSASASEVASLVAKPLAQKGKTVEKYVAKLRPPVLVGDKGASGKAVMRVVRYSAKAYKSFFFVKVLKIKYGASAPGFTGIALRCGASLYARADVTWRNITSGKKGHAKRYSFKGRKEVGSGSLAAAHKVIQDFLSGVKIFQVGYPANSGALCGEVKKVM